ncbi:MAG: AI-2E family transporter, partial [Burkholderiales bacterium]|nr:AI-2E family transporter [Burkholderiales bacterium]
MLFTLTSEQKQSVIWISLWGALLFLLFLLSSVLTPFIAAAMLAYALNPGVDKFTEFRIGKFYLPRSLAVVLVILIFLSAVLALILIVVPVLQKEGVQLRDQIPTFLLKLNTWAGPKLREYGVHQALDIDSIKILLNKQ